MKKLNLFTGGHPLKLDDIVHLQDGLRESIQQIAIHLKGGSDSPYILFGCDVNFIPGTSFQILNNGAIYHSGEIFLVEAASAVPTAAGTLGDLYWDVLETTVPPSQITYQDTSNKNVHVVRTAVINDTGGTIGTVAAVLPITGAITTDSIGGPAIPWDDSISATGINSGSDLTDYIQAILDTIGDLRSVIGSQYGNLHEFKVGIQLINGNLFPAVWCASDSSNWDITNLSGSTYFYEGVSQGAGNKMYNTLYFNDSNTPGFYDNGNNWQGNKYIVPENGTYNFFIENLVLRNTGEADQISNQLRMFGPAVTDRTVTSDEVTKLTRTDWTVITPSGSDITSLRDVNSALAGFGTGVSLGNMNNINFRIQLWVRRAGAQISTPGFGPEVAAIVAPSVGYSFQLQELIDPTPTPDPNQPGEYAAIAYIPSWSTQNQTVYTDPSVSYDPILGLGLQTGDEVYFILVLHSGGQNCYAAVQTEGVAFCEKN